MRLEDINRVLKGANELHKLKLYSRPTTGGKVKIWVYSDYTRRSLGVPAMQITETNPRPDESIFLKKAIELRNKLEEQESDIDILKADRTKKVSVLLNEWANHYTTESSKRNAKLAGDKLKAANGDFPIGTINRLHIIKMMDAMKKIGTFHINSIRTTASKIRAFCNYAEQRGYCNRVDTRKLLPPEEFGEVKALNEEEIKLLANAPCEHFPDIKELFLLGVYTAQRIGEIKRYTFKLLEDKQIKVRQGKTGKFIIIPLSPAAIKIIETLKERRETEGLEAGPKSLIFKLPSNPQIGKAFKEWLEAAGLPRNRITPHNSRSTAISLLINKGVPESVTQELANHADPRITSRYYRQLDDAKKREALNLIPEF